MAGQNGGVVEGKSGLNSAQRTHTNPRLLHYVPVNLRRRLLGSLRQVFEARQFMKLILQLSLGIGQ